MYRDFFHAIVAYSKQRLMTTFFNYENPEFLGISSYMPDFPVSSIVDNLILMSLVEINNSLHRCMSVVKSRGSKHSFDTREFVIGQGGISLVPLEENLVPAIPLQEYSSLLEPGAHKILSPETNQWGFRGAEQGMIPEAPGRIDADTRLPPAVSTRSPSRFSLADENDAVDLSAKMLADLLDFDAWGEVLKTYGRTMRVAVALTDSGGLLLGKCHNPQPVWTLIRGAASEGGAGCPFCITKRLPCTAVADAVRTGAVVVVHDQAGLTHVAVPLTLGKQTLGAIIAGQVFDRYPQPLSLRRVARDYGISAQELWEVAKQERPVASALLQASGDLLCALGHAFLQQRHGAILEKKLAETNDRFRWLAEGIRDYALFTLDTTGRVTSWNVGAERMLGYTQAEIVGQNFSCILSPDDVQRQAAEKPVSQGLAEGRAEYEGWSLRRTREQFWANVNITALSSAAGAIRGFAIIMQDMTERKKIATVLEEAQRERSRLQEKFLSHVSHELRTPLTAIYFFTTNVLDGVFGDLNLEQRKHLTFALDNIGQLKNMVSDLLDITRVETHKLTLVHQPTRLGKVTDEVLSTCGTHAAAKNISLRSEVAPDLHFVWADPARVRQILTNLIDNGIKFTPDSGTITVKGDLFGEDPDFVRVSVSDSDAESAPKTAKSSLTGWRR